MRRASKVDRNQPEIVAALRKAGATVQTLHAVGGGVPDLLVAFRGYTFLIEVKDGCKPPSERKLTEAEAAWIGAWSGHVAIVESVTDAQVVLDGYARRQSSVEEYAT